MKKRRTAHIAGGILLVVGVSLLTYDVRQRKAPSACRYSLRSTLDLPHLFVTRSRLREMLSPQPGERVLEIGPGTGYYSLHAARWLEPEGTLEVLDIQQEMLDHTMLRLCLPGRHSRRGTRPRACVARATPRPQAWWPTGGSRSFTRPPQGILRRPSQADEYGRAELRAKSRG